MTINYAAVTTVHRVNALLSVEGTHRRLCEVLNNLYQQDPRCRALKKVLTKKSGTSKTEMDVLRDFPEEGIFLGNVSNALIFANPFRFMPITRHKAIVSLIKQGALAIVEGYVLDRDVSCGKVQVIVKV